MAKADLTSSATNPIMPRFAFGSNGWVVGKDKSASNTPLFAFDSHDELGLPNLFYEVHLFFNHKGGKQTNQRLVGCRACQG